MKKSFGYMKLTNKIFILFFIMIVTFGTLLRFYRLGQIPQSMEWDEVSYGYNAYSVLKTGKDEYGITFPLTFKAFGEYKQPVYAYLDVISIDLFGLNSFAVRFPSAFFGSISIIFVYFLVAELFQKYRFAKKLALLSMTFYAISPWSIQFSRAAFEANVSLCFVIIAVWLFIRGVSVRKKWYFLVSTLILSLSTYTYISQKVIVPFLFVALCLFSFSYLKKEKFLAGSIIIIFLILNFFWIFDTKSVTRGSSVAFINQQEQLMNIPARERNYDHINNDSFGSIIHNRRTVFAQKFIENYVSHYNLVWLFITGDGTNRHHAPGMGVLYLISLPFILLGMYFLVSRTLAVSWFILFWLLIAPLAASLTTESPHALRSLIFLPTWHIFEAAGVIFLLQKVKKERLLQFAILFLYLVNMTYYFHQYFIHVNTDYQKDWQYGYKEAVEYVQKYNNTEKHVIFSNKFEQPYIFYLFYTKYDPAKYIALGGSARTGNNCYTIAHAYFGDCRSKLRSGDVYITVEDDTIDKAREVKHFDYAYGKRVISIYEYE
jgi:4-amino-4-deoxy-L-arabinose transferase-like glycosyltransferase